MRTLYAAVGVCLAAALLTGCGASKPEAEETSDDSTMFTAVVDACGLPSTVLGDGGTTLTLDGKGDDYGSGDLAVQDIACALKSIGTPDSIVSEIEQTRSIDGRQTAENNGYSYSWSYHPDNGLDMVITDAYQE